MAKLIFGLQQSLDGYVDHLEMRPGEVGVGSLQLPCTAMRALNR